MLRYSDEDLADTLIHELVHTTLWIKDNARFNERLASYLGQKGAEQFFLSKEGPQSPSYQKMQDATHDDQIFSHFITEQVKELDEWYRSLKPEEKTAENKEARIKKIQDLFTQKILPQMKSKSWSHFSKVKLNNAKLMMYKTYMSDFSAFDQLWKSVNGDFTIFLEKCKTLKNSKHPDQDLARLSQT